MSSSRPLTDLIREFRSAGATVVERIDALVLSGRFPDAGAQAGWIALSQAPPAPMTAVQVYDPEISGDVGASEAFDPERRVSITVVKPGVEGVGFFFLQETLAAYLAGPIGPMALRIADLPARGAFQSRGLDVAPWALDAPPPSPPIPIEISPSKLVADYVPAREVPWDLSPWLLLHPPPEPSPAFESWRAIAARRLMSGLVSSASEEAGVVWLQASGPPTYRVRADDPAIAASWAMLTQVANWVFLSGPDIEARQRLFSGELARAGRPGQDFPTTLTRAFEAVKAAYAAHIQSASRETLKALADLRKTVIEETQKVTQRAQDMTAGLGRDLAVSAAPFALKILADAGKVTAPVIAAGFYFAAAGFVAVSFGLQWRINKAFLRSQKQSRQRWMQTLYTYISAEEREEIADQPIQQAIRNYRETRAVLLVIYLALVTALAGAGYYTLTHAKAAPPTAAPGQIGGPTGRPQAVKPTTPPGAPASPPAAGRPSKEAAKPAKP